MTGLRPVPDQVAVLVARAWTESGGLRARVTRTPDINTTAEQVVVTASEDEVLEIVREWLAEVREAAGGRRG